MSEGSSENRARRSKEYVKAAKDVEADDAGKAFQAAFAKAAPLRHSGEDKKEQGGDEPSG